jgi:type I restriction enzyme S subunit
MKNWEVKKLGEVCKFVGGSQPPKSLFSYEDKEDYIRLIQIRDYKSDKNIVYIPKEKAKRFCDSKDIMIGRYGPPVFQILKGLDGAYNVALMKAVPNEKVLSKDYAFLFLKFSKIQDYIIHLSQRAAGQTGVNKEAIEDYPILVPPLSEQQRIVAILDEVFEAIAKAKANAEQSLKNAKELFESYLRGMFENRGEDWEEKTLKEVFEIGSSKRVLKSQWKTEGVPFYRGREITRLAIDGFVNNELYISEAHYQELLKRYGVPNPGDIVITAIGTIGNFHIVRDDDKFYFKDASVLWLKRSTTVNSEFIKFWLKSDLFFSQLDKDNGATVDTLTIKKLQSLEISLPNEREQKAIVYKLDALSIETKRLEVIYQQKLIDLEELKKSVLQKAFAGELKKKLLSTI